MTLGYSEEFRRAREQAEAERQRQLEEMRRENEAARRRYRAQLEAERQAQRERAAAELEAELAPVKEQERRQWLIDHPDCKPEDFERVWPLIREEKYTSFAARVQREIEAQRARSRW